MLPPVRHSMPGIAHPLKAPHQHLPLPGKRIDAASTRRSIRTIEQDHSAVPKRGFHAGSRHVNKGSVHNTDTD